MISLLLKINLPDLHYSSRNIQTLLTIHFIFQEKATVEFMFHMALGNFTKTIYNSTSPTDVMLRTNILMLALMVAPLPASLEHSTTSKV
jgi:hypothetical protein